MEENPTEPPPPPVSLFPRRRDIKPPPDSNPAGGGGGERVKRDEWSEGAVSSLLEAYEAKWVLRNRAKLKGRDWEDVARHVSARASSTKPPKSLTQCKNKIESMKKRYRSESAAPAPSWPLFPRIDLLLRGAPAAADADALPLAPNKPPWILLHPPPPNLPPPPSHPPLNLKPPMAKEDAEVGELPDRVPDEIAAVDTDSSTPAALYSEEREVRSPKGRAAKRRRAWRGEECCEVAENIRWLTEVVAKSEAARMETVREVEKMRIEAEARRGEMELKRIEIIAKTQVEIARIFAGGKGVDSSLRIGRD